MSQRKNYIRIDDTQHLMLTVEEIDEEESFRNLSHEQKMELILLIYYISLALYHSYSKEHEPP